MTNMSLYSRGDKLFVIVNMVLLALFTISTLYPFIYIASLSMITGFEARAGNVVLTPVDFTLEAYRRVLIEPQFWTSYKNTFIYTIGGTLMSLAFIIPGAYALSKPQLYGRRFWNLVVAFTMWFNAGLIPFFLNMRDLGLLDSYFGIIIGFAVNGFNIILLRNFFEGKAKAMAATGRIIAAEERDDHIYVRGDATPAYRTLSPEVTLAEREVYFVRNSYFVIVDSVDAETPVSVDWLLHANAPYDLGKTSFRYTGERAGFYGQVVWSEAGKPELTQETGFPDVDSKEFEGLPVSTCLHARFPKATRHRIATLLVPYKLTEPKRIFHFLDDQGYDADLYFTDPEENSFRVVMKKLAKA